MFAPCTSEQATSAIESANMSGARNSQLSREVSALAAKLPSVMVRAGALRPSELGKRIAKTIRTILPG
jgi:hypothetical protein